MDDLSAKLSSVLSDPAAMKEIAALAAGLGINPAPESSEDPTPPGQRQPELSALSMLGGLAPVLGSVNADDDVTRLLSAIRPFLSEERRQKLDKAKKLLRVMRLLPMLRELDLFDL